VRTISHHVRLKCCLVSLGQRAAPFFELVSLGATYSHKRVIMPSEAPTFESRIGTGVARLAFKAGIKSLSKKDGCVEDVQDVIVNRVKEIVDNAAMACLFEKKKRVTGAHIVFALSQFGEHVAAIADTKSSVSAATPKRNKAPKSKNGKTIKRSRASQNILYAQYTTGTLIQKAPFQRIVRELLSKHGKHGKNEKHLSILADALCTLQAAVEDYTVVVLRCARLCAEHTTPASVKKKNPGHKTTVRAKDLAMALELRNKSYT
jgi:histone H3/H4